MEERLILKFYKEDTGSFRTYYKEETKGGLFCLQPAEGLTLTQYKETGKTDLFICSSDGEPSHKVKKEKFVFRYSREDYREYVNGKYEQVEKIK